MEGKLGRPRGIMYGSLALAFLAAIPWVGWWPIGLIAVAVLSYIPMASRISTTARPEFLIAATVVNAQLLLGVGIALTGGPRSPAIPILLLPLITLPARFTSRGVYAGLGITVVILLAATIGVDPSGFATDPTFTLTGLAIAVGLTAFADTLMRVEMEQRSDAVLDPLTGLLNRNSLGARFEEIAQQAAVAGGSVSVLACDLDHFKQINDVYGHESGDRVLKETAYVMRKHLRSFELVYRMGGEEFLIVLPGASLAEGTAIAERVRAAVETARPCGLDVTVSVGVAAASGNGVVFEPLFRAADAMLYEAKRTGRNRVAAERHAVAV
jgi:diguanylate cyclase (GGDEF)-like protein